LRDQASIKISAIIEIGWNKDSNFLFISFFSVLQFFFLFIVLFKARINEDNEA